MTPPGTDRLAVVVPVFNEPGITRTLDALLHQQGRTELHVYVVDNGCTDDTVLRVRRFADAHPGLPVTVLHEPQKGTGAACDTGFRAAIAAGHPIVARTDGDSAPAADWAEHIRYVFDRHPQVQLVGGTSVPLRDEHHRAADALVMPLALHVLRIMLTVQRLDIAYLRFVAGHNLAVRARAYLEVGGFGRTSIDTHDEDIVLSVRIIRRLGFRAVRIERDLRVATSMRRVRRYGVGRSSVHYLVPALRGKLIRSVDVR